MKMGGWISRMFHTRNRFVMLTLFKSLVRSRIDYCSPLWSPATKQDISTLESVQRTFTFQIEEMAELNYWERLNSLNLMSIQHRHERYILIHMWKIYAGIAPNDIGILFYWTDRLGVWCHVTKIKRVLSVQALVYNSFSNMGPLLFNSIPANVKVADNVNSFKNALDKWLRLIPDKPPTPGYIGVNDNTILEWLSSTPQCREHLRTWWTHKVELALAVPTN